MGTVHRRDQDHDLAMNRKQVEGLAALAGIPFRSIYETPNQYWQGKSDIRGPWWLIITNAGVIRIGWRKRVIEIDWSDVGRHVDVTNDEVTKDGTLVHAWTYPKALEYLTTLWHELQEPSAPASDNK